MSARLASPPLSAIDMLYRKFVLTRFFTKGWGKPRVNITAQSASGRFYKLNHSFQDLKRICQLRRKMSSREAALGIIARDSHVLDITKDKTEGKVR